MSERPGCDCALCQIEGQLLTDFLDSKREATCREIIASASELSAFSSVGPLLAHLRLCRDTVSSDAVLRSLLRAKQMFCDGTVECMFVLAFLPQMHSAVRSALRCYPQLSPEDASQNVLQALLRFVASNQLASRQDYLGFAIARHVKRAAFNWAEQEVRSLIFDAKANTTELNGSGDSFERVVLLRHFLDRAVRRGVLDSDELDLLIHFKLENGLDDDSPELHSNAHRQRLKRLVHKLRRLATVRNAPRNEH